MNATPLILLHGVGLNRSMWDHFRQNLGVESEALDLPGHGGQAPLRRPTTLAELSEDVLSRCPAGQVDLLGFSLGSLIAQWIGVHRPERVRSLTLVSSVFQRSAPERAAVQERLRSAEADFSGSIAKSVRRWYPEEDLVSALRRQEALEMLSRNDQESYLHAYRVFADADSQLAAHVRHISCPTLIMTGSLDTGSTPAMSEALSSEIPQSRLRIVESSRHMFPIEKEDVLATEVLAHLSDTKGEVDGRKVR